MGPPFATAASTAMAVKPKTASKRSVPPEPPAEETADIGQFWRRATVTNTGTSYRIALSNPTLCIDLAQDAAVHDRTTNELRGEIAPFRSRFGGSAHRHRGADLRAHGQRGLGRRSGPR